MVEVSGCGYLGVPSHLFLEDEEMDILTFGDERGDLGFVVEVSGFRVSVRTISKKPRQNGRKMTSFRGVMGRHGQAGSWRGQWTGWIGSAPVQISGCGLDGALS